MKTKLSEVVILLSVFMVTVDSMAVEWRQFRGPGGQGATSEKNLPLKWSDTENIAWKTELPGNGASSPVSLGRRLYLTCYSGYGDGKTDAGRMEDLMLHVVCVSNEGQILWDEHVEPKLPESKTVRDHGYAGPTPATDGQDLYVFFGKSGVLKFDLDGRQLWRADVGEETHSWGCGTSPVLHGDLVIVNASVESGSLVAINKNDGSEAWRVGGMEASWNTPHLVDIGNRQELVVSVKNKILAFDPATGDELWQCAGIEDYVCPSIVSHEGVVYVIGGRQSKAIAIRAGGRGDVTGSSHEIWRTKAGANVCSPVVHDGHLYWVSDRNKVAYCVRLADGEVIYQKRFPDQPYASPLVGDGKLYIVTRNGGTYVLAAKPEFEQLAHNELDDDSTFNASPIVADGKLFLRSDRFLYCIDR